MLGCRRHPDESHENCYRCDLNSSMYIFVQGCNLYGCKQFACKCIALTSASRLRHELKMPGTVHICMLLICMTNLDKQRKSSVRHLKILPCKEL